ncbi:MAG: hypothetical protein ABSE43_09150 [Steroidobacteraceae bacterium]
MKIWAHLIIVAAIGIGTAGAECPPPSVQVQIPSGATATRDDMVAAQKAVKAYDNAVKEYSGCLQREAVVGSDRLENIEVDRLKIVAAKFNNELKIFKEKNAD